MRDPYFNYIIRLLYNNYSLNIIEEISITSTCSEHTSPFTLVPGINNITRPYVIPTKLDMMHNTGGADDDCKSANAATLNGSKSTEAPNRCQMSWESLFPDNCK